MKKRYLLLLVFIVSCKNKKPILIEPIISNEIVTITSNEKKNSLKDSVDIHFPNEFNLSLQSRDIISLNIYYFINKKTLMNVTDYEILDKNNKNVILSFEPYLSSKDPITIVINERNHLISKKKAKELLLKYNTSQKLENLKFGDTIKLVNYKRFRNENTSMINDLKKVEDSIYFRVTLNNGKVFVKGEKINW
ncbi:hypothetical protein [Flavobacterium johnsoniae]|uniref:hypothetical protein n=1 Tax=Flavobacterium johnsoniae TaxID=986 RepID=UPI003D96900D